MTKKLSFFKILFRKELINCNHNQVRLLCDIISSLEIVVSMVGNYILEKYLRSAKGRVKKN